MSVKIQPNMTQNAQDIEICEDYWAYNHNDDYLEYVRILCQQYQISSHVLFETIAQCYACLDDVCCEYCECFCPIEVPADIPYMRSKESWCCEVCENAVWRTHNSK